MRNTTFPTLLLIETATEICSAAIACGSEVLACKESLDGYSHSKNLIAFVDEVLQMSGIGKEQLSGVGISIGPGSYTGLRIGASTVKGICYALDIPAIAISTLQSIMMGARQNFPDKEVLFCPMIDARRMEVYTALYNYDGELINDIKPLIIEEESFAELLKKERVVFCGNGMPKCRELLSKYPNALFSNVPISAIHLLEPALDKFEKKEFEDVAYFEPFYLKDYTAAKPVVKGLK